MHALSQKLVQIFINENSLDTNSFNWYVYSIERRLIELISTVIMCIIGGLVFDVKSSLIFIIVFKFLRSYTGGYHSKNSALCLLFSNIIMLLAIHLSHILLTFTTIIMPLTLFSTVSLLYLAPVNHPNLNWNTKEYKYAHRQMVIRLCFILSCIVFFNTFAISPFYCNLFSISLFFVSLTVILAKLLKQEVSAYEQN